ncbi:hypothetical protein M8J77_025977 [Diaphorina citri]|nr:hypothetical protein M8J77_025977 [Diaphorina citri]
MFTLWYAVLGYSEYKSRSSGSDGVVVNSSSGTKPDDPKSGEQNVVSPKISIGKPSPPTPSPPQPIPTKRPSPPKPEPPKPEPPKVTPKPEPPKSVPKPEPPKVTPKPEPPKTIPKPEPPKPAPPPKSREDQLFEQVLNRKTKASTPDPRVTSGLMLNEYSSEEEENEDSQEEDFVQEERRRAKYVTLWFLLSVKIVYLARNFDSKSCVKIC